MFDPLRATSAPASRTVAAAARAPQVISAEPDRERRTRNVIQGARVAAQERLGQVLNQSARVAQLKARGAALNGGNEAGLPERLKSGIEALSGLSMDHVRVHRNSPRPAQLRALAYAQGSEIHLGPGQEQHLPHEAWHVVQQMQGRVRATAQLRDVGLNDDTALEVEADRMGEQAARHPDAMGTEALQARPPGPMVAQRKIKTFRDTGNKDMSELADALDKCVAMAKLIVDSNPLLQGVPNNDKGYLGAWVSTFSEFLADTDGTAPAFFYARYGYAIETIATGLFLQGDNKGYEIHSQVAQGSTRPDFVIAKGAVHHAWLDITSSASEGHIQNKQGGKWTTCGHVSEILYDMPSPSDFAKSATGKLTKEQLEALARADAARATRVARFTVGMGKMAIILANAFMAERAKKGSGLSKTDVRKIVSETCGQHLDKFVAGGIKPRHAAGVLASIERIEIEGETHPGDAWAKWASFDSTDLLTGRSLLYDFGNT